MQIYVGFVMQHSSPTVLWQAQRASVWEASSKIITQQANFKQHFAQIQSLCLLQQISATMQKFEGMFEDLDVNTQVMSGSTIFYTL